MQLIWLKSDLSLWPPPFTDICRGVGDLSKPPW
jgi:hypothetical protein